MVNQPHTCTAGTCGRGPSEPRTGANKVDGPVMARWVVGEGGAYLQTAGEEEFLIYPHRHRRLVLHGPRRQGQCHTV
jgi:hypothetical protein